MIRRACYLQRYFAVSIGMQAKWDNLDPQRRATLLAGGLMLATVLLVLLLVRGISAMAYQSKCATVRQNLHMIQLGAERYAVDNDGNYPLDIRTLSKTGYLPVLPTNPFTGQPMRCVKDAASAQAGDFSYETQAAPGSTGATSYTLKAYF